MISFDDLWTAVTERLPQEADAAEAARLVLPLLLIRRLDCLLKDSKDRVLAADRSMGGSLTVLQKSDILYKAASESFYNICPQNMQAAVLNADSLLAYINGFSEEIRLILGGLGVYGLASGEERYQPLLELAQYMAQLDLSRDAADGRELGELWQKVADIAYEGCISDEKKRLHKLVVTIFSGVCRNRPKYMNEQTLIYSPCMQDGQLLHMLRQQLEASFANFECNIAGQEADALEYSLVCAIQLLMDKPLDNFAAGSVLAADKLKVHADYVIADLPKGDNWSELEAAVRQDYKALGFKGRFSAGLPDMADSQMLYMQQLVQCLLPMERGGGRAAFITDQHPLYDGGVGSGESEIRKWLFRLDVVESIVELPYLENGAKRYLWLCNNMKKAEQRGAVQLVNATQLWQTKGAETDKINQLIDLLTEVSNSKYSVILGYEHFSYEEITLIRPWQRNYAVTPERLERLLKIERLTSLLDDFGQLELIQSLAAIGGSVYRNRENFHKKVAGALQQMEVSLPTDIEALVIDALSEHDDKAEISLDKNGNAVIDIYWQDKERVYLCNDVKKYFAEFIEPFAPNAIIDDSQTKRGYEISFAKYFRKTIPEVSRHELAEKIKRLEKKLAAEIGDLI